MKKTLFFVFFLLFGVVGLVFALEVPKPIAENCLLIEDKYIDSCPQYRNKIKPINEKFFDIFDAEEKKATTSKDLLLSVNKFLVKLNTMKKDLYMHRQLTGDKAFTADYMIYVVELYRDTIQSKVDYKGSMQQLFTKTYYNQIQSGLTIQSVSIFDEKSNIEVYDTDVTATFAIRNFEKTAVAEVEDIYCFATIGTEDFIFPLAGKGMVFPANSVTNIVGTLKIGENNLSSIPGKKTLYCMVVYKDDAGKEVTSPFMPFDFTVE